MTPRELAEKIVDMFCSRNAMNDWNDYVKKIESILAEALNDAYREALQDLEKNRFRSTGGVKKEPPQ